MSATMLLYLFDGFADWEPAYLCAGLAKAGWKILSVSRDGRPVRSMGGLLIQPDCALSAVPRRLICWCCRRRGLAGRRQRRGAAAGAACCQKQRSYRGHMQRGGLSGYAWLPQ